MYQNQWDIFCFFLCSLRSEQGVDIFPCGRLWRHTDGYIFTPLMPNTSTRIVLKKPKTDSSIRKVWLPKTLAYILREWKKSQDELKGFLGDEYQDFDLVGGTSKWTALRGSDHPQRVCKAP